MRVNLNRGDAKGVGRLAATRRAMQSPPLLGKGPQYLDGYKTQEAAGFRKQGGKVICVDNQHLCGKDSLHVRVKQSSSGDG